MKKNGGSINGNANDAPIARRRHYIIPPSEGGKHVAPRIPVEPGADDYDLPDGYEPDKTNKTAMIVAVASASVIALAVFGFLAFLFFGKGAASSGTAPTTAATEASTEPETTKSTVENDLARIVTMPYLYGLTESEAYKALNEAGVRYRVTREYSDTVPSGSVVAQSPEAGETFTRAEEATIRLSKGKENEIMTSPSKPATEPSTTKPTQSSRSSDSDYLLPQSNSKRLSKNDLKKFDRKTLNLALNEIFARHGRIFSDPDIKAYFESKSWYHGTVRPENFDNGVLNTYEAYNVSLITGYQTELGYR